MWKKLHLYFAVITSWQIICEAKNDLINCSSVEEWKKSIFLWSIESDDGMKNYMFGTIHVPFTEVWEHVSERVKEAFRQSNSVVFELDLYNPKTVQTLMQCKNMKDGGNVTHYLPPTLHQRLKLYMRKYRRRLADWLNRAGETKKEAKKRAKHIYNNVAGNWEQRRPVWLLFLLYQLSEKFAHREHIPMLDLYLAQNAMESDKKLLSIETPNEQCNPLSSIGNEQVIFAINYTLSYLEFEQSLLSIRENDEDDKLGLSELIHHYNCGSLEASVFNADSKRLNQLGFSLSPEHDKRAQQIDSQLREDIIVRRNIRMANRIAALLRSKRDSQYFFALGAGHFMGENSVLDILKSHGFKTKPVVEDDYISFSRLTMNKREKKIQ